MKMKRLLVLSALLVAGVVQAATIHWSGSAAIFGHPGDSSWTTADSWGEQGPNTAGVPVAGDTVIIQRYIWGNEGIPGGGWDSGATPTTLDATVAGLADIYLSQADSGIVGGQIGQLDLVSGANLSAANLLMGHIASATDTLNLSGNGALSINGYFVGAGAGSTSQINMSGTSTMDVLAAVIPGAGGTLAVSMDADSVLTIAGGDIAWANTVITALNSGGGDSIATADIGGGTIQYTVIPEPATLGMVALLGGGILWIRKRFVI